MASTDTTDSRHPLPEGSALGRTWTVIELVGEDHLSMRYKVRGAQLGNVCLARVFTARRCLEDADVRAAIREAALAQSRVTHGGVVAVRDIFCVSQTHELVVVTDYIEGPSVATWLATHGPLGEDEAADVVRQLLSALIACHRKGLLHLNLRPRSVTLASDGTGDELRVVVDDFGLPTEADGDADAAGYRAPEQRAGEPLDERADVFAVGALYYELLTGEPPDLERGAGELRAVLPTLPLTIERVVRRALAPEAGERFPNVRAMRAALASDSAILSVKPVVSTSRVGIETLERPVQRPSVHGLVVVGGLVVLLLVGWLAWRGWQAATEASPADDTALAPDPAAFVGFDPRAMFGDDEPDSELPAITAENPVPVSALPSVGTAPALVDLVVVTSLDSPYASPVVVGSLVEPLQVRYGDNVRVAWLVLPERSRPGSLERVRAALAAQRQAAFMPYVDMLVRMPGVHERDTLVALAESLGLDARRFDLDLDAAGLDELVAHHESLAQQLGAGSAGQVFVNARPVEYGPDAPRVVSSEVLIAAIDAELDAVQRALAEHVSPDEVAAHRAAINLATRRDTDTPEVLEPAGPATARRLRVPLDGLPGLGTSNAPLSVVVFADLTRPGDRATLDQLEAFYHAHPELVRLVVKLAPAADSQPGFDLAMRLMAAHAAGGFWRALDEPGPATVHPHDPPQAELLRSRLIEHARETTAIAADRTDGPLVLANGRVLAAGPDAMARGLEEERRLVERFVSAGIARDDVHELITATSEPLPQTPAPSPGRFMVANWQALPRSGPVEAPIIVFWRFSLLDPDWRATLAALRALRVAFRDDVSVVLAPAPPSDARDTDPTFDLFARWWGKDSADIDVGLETLAAVAAAHPDLAGGPDAVRALVEIVAPRPRPRPQLEPDVDEPVDDLDDELDDDPDDDDTVDPAAVAADQEARVRDVIASHAIQWTAEDAALGSVLIAWRRGLSFVGWTLPGGLAFEPYWDAVRRARQRQAQ